ncbi:MULTISPECIES: DNA polymerase III subunit theta [Pectobacterium]|uniref:DNA polymerase III subunit theta n=1 Tax=Pectobacterium carotovorum subsp. carotovorum TaxID=555 RepID=A0AAI9PDN9_PECCC|nr:MULTISPECIES: DNA polymerase III subunit theta [Pectobacterium]MBE5221380.1 DNA polymerase III subunit theta [Pectobacterium quasiaquaticum]POE07470.1 DNA polymerase III subunit theta [Pectobacterium odoriferum]TKY84049.1 DNA polymerase III subunit theta [Pectobacterium polonicum]GKV90478.1 DNA polymerase III subunit theta [Pectobacterium carotovorum subsp. carotovorum]GKW07597.1 DNA polymerase III subunit theta [Pectobacterium carotovorum subsp. carotovorum]
MTHNLGDLPREEREKVNVDLAASSVAYKERLNLPVIAEQVEREQPEHLREYFRQRVSHYREVSKQLPRGTAPVYQKMAEDNGKK